MHAISSKAALLRDNQSSKVSSGWVKLICVPLFRAVIVEDSCNTTYLPVRVLIDHLPSIEETPFICLMPS